MDEAAMTAEAFAEHLDTVFTVVSGEERREIRLVKVDAKPELMEGAKNPDGSDFYTRVPFVLSFTGPVEELFGQSLYEVEHAALGKMSLFVKPYAKDERTAYYESIFN